MAMRDKKNRASDAEDRRLTAFLLGLVLVLAVLLVALEYNSADDATASDEQLLKELMEEGEAMPVMSYAELTILPEQKMQTEGERIKVVADDAPTDEDETIEDTSVGDTLTAWADSSLTVAEQIPPANMEGDEDNPLHFRVVEDIPQFPGGTAAFVKWLSKNMRYPMAAQRQGIKGKVTVSFIVEKDGKISDIKMVQPLHPECNEEALRVLRMMPDWTPGRMNGEVCRTMVCVPIVFKM